MSMRGWNPAAFDRWLTTEPERLCEWCGSPEECLDSCDSPDREADRAQDEDADAAEANARE